MDVKTLNGAIYDKYIRPIRRPATEKAGLEFELPIVNLKKQPVDFDLVHGLTGMFLERFGFGDEHRDDEGNIYCAADPVTGDTLSYDCSYNTLEISFGAEDDLDRVYDRFTAYYAFIQDYLLPRGHSLTGMGVNPYREYNENIPIPNGRYRMLLHHLRSYKNYGDVIDFHDVPEFGLFSCASQVQLDAEEDTVVEALNAFSRLEPWKALLLANSPFRDYLCARDFFWKKSMHGVNPRNVDAYDKPLTSVEDLVDYIRGMSLYCLERDGKYLNFAPTPLEEYFAKETVTGEYFNGAGYSEYTFEPRLSDLGWLRSFKFEDLTFRGTIEFRSVCQQPVRQIMAPAALHAGLMKNLSGLTELMAGTEERFGCGPSALRERFVKRELPADLDKKAASKLLLDILALAEDGLKRRGRGEERFLAPLYRRAELLQSPAREMEIGLENGKTLEYYIEDFARLT